MSVVLSIRNIKILFHLKLFYYLRILEVFPLLNHSLSSSTRIQSWSFGISSKRIIYLGKIREICRIREVASCRNLGDEWLNLLGSLDLIKKLRSLFKLDHDAKSNKCNSLYQSNSIKRKNNKKTLFLIKKN